LDELGCSGGGEGGDDFVWFGAALVVGVGPGLGDGAVLCDDERAWDWELPAGAVVEGLEVDAEGGVGLAELVGELEAEAEGFGDGVAWVGE